MPVLTGEFNFIKCFVIHVVYTYCQCFSGAGPLRKQENHCTLKKTLTLARSRLLRCSWKAAGLFSAAWRDTSGGGKRKKGERGWWEMRTLLHIDSDGSRDAPFQRVTMWEQNRLPIEEDRLKAEVAQDMTVRGSATLTAACCVNMNKPLQLSLSATAADCFCLLRCPSCSVLVAAFNSEAAAGSVVANSDDTA